MRQLIKIFKALSDETKLRIMKILQLRDELCVCEIMQALDISQSRASRNLGILKDADLVNDRRDGVWIYYSINKKKTTEFNQTINELMGQWLKDDEIILADRERLSKAVKYSQCKKRP